MCGIAGILTTRQDLDIQGALQRMTAAMNHRGPDAQGSLVRSAGPLRIGLAHTRLAIIDLSAAAAQPMENSANRTWISYNGETYNFIDLRRSLERDGQIFHSESDTEVVLKAFAKWGIQAFDRLRGMFALAIWDESHGRLHLARDPLGIKPLYVYQSHETLIFASEVRTILASGYPPRRLNPEGLSSYLRYGSVEAPATIVQDIRAILPSHHVVVESDRQSLSLQELPYTHAAPEAPEPSTRAEAIHHLRELLEKSVHGHLVSDVPLGIFLSGGIDSSVIVALASRVMDEKPKTFTVSFPESELSESEYAKIVSQTFGTDHKEILLSAEELARSLPQAFAAMDQPSIDGLNTFVISGALRAEGVTVALSGLGGDELFAGYPSFRRAKQVQALSQVPMPMRRIASGLAQFIMPQTPKVKKFLRLLTSDGHPETAYDVSRSLFLEDEVSQLLNTTDFAAQIPQELKAPAPDLINAVSRHELHGYMTNTLLRDTDAMSMAHGLEIRVPFVDPVVVPYVLNLPGDWKFDGRRPKPLLLDTVGEKLLPEQSWRRPKVGFTLPIGPWMKSTLQAAIDESLLAHATGFQSLGLNPESVTLEWRRFQRDRSGSGWTRPWALYVLAQWCDKHQVML